MFESRKVRVGSRVAVVLVAVAVVGLTARHFVRNGWPLSRANPYLVVAAGLLFVLAYAFKAWGWQRLFPRNERPRKLALAVAGGAAALGGVALPGRFDEAIRIAVVRRFPGRRAGLGAVCLSIFVVGLLDSAALAPMASIAAVAARSTGVQIGFAFVALAGVAAAAVVLALPRLAGTGRLRRFKLCSWVRLHTVCRGETSRAWLLVTVSWVLRAVAVFLLLNALAVGGSFPLALAFLCATAASAAIPIAPAGAATQAGAGAAILAANGISAGKAVGFAVAAQGLIIFAGGVIVVLATVWQGLLRLSPRRAVAR